LLISQNALTLIYVTEGFQIVSGDSRTPSGTGREGRRGIGERREGKEVGGLREPSNEVGK